MGNKSDDAVNSFVENTYVSQKFGEKNPQFYGRGSHQGTDYHADENSKVFGIDGWKVLDTYKDAATGNNVIIVNPETGERLRFAHLNKTLVKRGDTLAGDNPIALSGNTGYSTTGPHLHVEYQDANGVISDVTKTALKLKATPTATAKDNINKVFDSVSGMFVPKPAMAQKLVPGATPKKKQEEVLMPYSQKGWEEMQRAEMDNAVKSGNYAGKSQGSYQIKYGDTLSQLARSYNSTVADFMRANPSIQDANKIRAGAVINVPSSPIKSSYNYSTAKSVPTAPKTNGFTSNVANPYPMKVNGFTSSKPSNPYPVKTTGNYTVRSGDNLSTIAKNLGTTVGELARKNNIVNPNKIFAGITLKT